MVCFMRMHSCRSIPVNFLYSDSCNNTQFSCRKTVLVTVVRLKFLRGKDVRVLYTDLSASADPLRRKQPRSEPLSAMDNSHPTASRFLYLF
jgi:hypothetical protein